MGVNILPTAGDRVHRLQVPAGRGHQLWVLTYSRLQLATEYTDCRYLPAGDTNCGC